MPHFAYAGKCRGFIGVGATHTVAYDPPGDKADLPSWPAGIARPGRTSRAIPGNGSGDCGSCLDIGGDCKNGSHTFSNSLLIFLPCIERIKYL